MTPPGRTTRAISASARSTGTMCSRAERDSSTAKLPPENGSVAASARVKRTEACRAPPSRARTRPASLGARFRGLEQRQPEIRAHNTGFREARHRQAVDAVAAADVEHCAALQHSVSPLHGRDQTARPLELLVGGARVLFRRPLRPRRDRRAVAEDTLAKARYDTHGPPVGAHERCVRR